MKVLVYIFIASALFLSCGSKNENNKEEAKTGQEQPANHADGESDGLVMYEMSEMAALMEQMYVDNMRLKERITNGDTIGNFPSHFLKIHASAMTDESENDAFFKEQAAKFIKAQELIYKDSINASKHFNDAVSSCVKCHEVKCTGPIPRIKKLYIK
ncbi:hypothetical protein [Flavobacterium sp. MK4S-17]|uniref:hypothetical protein n=1 Tax=Flavobacterium sp. MK4S-17 TaxID=2543737 RepID=UPI00135BE54F|nr:hypothetical protein [Flavobacterium sp. MK4S-17]